MAEASSVHVPVLLDQVVQWLSPREGSVVVDGTLGGGGHSRALAQRVGKGGLVVALDRDPAAVAAAGESWPNARSSRSMPISATCPRCSRELGIERVDGIVLDLGLSGDQLADPERGFSFSSPGPLDLRFDPMRGEPAKRLINRLSAEHLADLIYHYGEERYSRRVARAIVERRREKPIETAAELAELVRRCVPRSRVERIDPATRTFQALRIAVNDELKSLEIALRRLPDCLRPGARLAVISFHSLEDRRVKEAFRDDPRLQVLTRKPVCAETAEVDRNPGADEVRNSAWPSALSRWVLRGYWRDGEVFWPGIAQQQVPCSVGNAATPHCSVKLEEMCPMRRLCFSITRRSRNQKGFGDFGIWDLGSPRTESQPFVQAWFASWPPKSLRMFPQS